MSPTVLYVDNHLLVASKPAGMPAQPDESGDLDLLTWARDWIKRRYDKPGNVFIGLVHRLDRPASGVTILARTSKAASRLARGFRDRQVDKRYLAILEGNPPISARWIDFIAKEGRTPQLVAESAPGARRAELDFSVVEQNHGLTLVDIRLETGRPHQIRLQFSSRGFPLLGDLRYGAGSALDGRNLALHCYRVAIAHPVGDRAMTWVAEPPETWPDAFRQSVKQRVH